ncbi:MAG: N-6 DNA methylase [Thermomicrobiales bacterium]
MSQQSRADFVQSERFVEEYAGKIGDVSVYGQEPTPTTWWLALMNLATLGIKTDLGDAHADTFHNDQNPDQKADYIPANPPVRLNTTADWRAPTGANWIHAAKKHSR